jgi:hypothetical protein
LGILVAVVIACSGDDAPKPQDPESSPEATASSKALSADGTTAPMLPDSVRDYVLKNIMMNREVLESKIVQDGMEVSPVLIIDCAASETTAKSLGNKFLRAVKRFGPDQTPTRKEIGAGDFDYLIGVSCGDGSNIIQRAKASDSSEITW